MRGGASLKLDSIWIGKAEPFRTSGGKAARIIHVVIVTALSLELRKTFPAGSSRVKLR